jgi:dTDP-4-dehydrorhamnose reductase
MNLAEQKILVIGAHGMLGHDVISSFKKIGSELLISDLRSESLLDLPCMALDIVNTKRVREALNDLKPNVVINCAAFTAVDKAEVEQDTAFAINARGPGNLATSCKECGASLVHFSTDYVFGGEGIDGRTTPFTESDTPSPRGIYAQSKRYGEELVKNILPDDHLMIRTSWLHGVHGPNFVSTILNIEKDEIKVVNDQAGSPTWSPFLVQTMASLLEKEARGIFHVTSRGNITWYDFAVEILRQANKKVNVLAQDTKELNRPAPRPRFSTLALSKVESFLGKPCIDWKEGVKQHLAALAMLSEAN